MNAEITLDELQHAYEERVQRDIHDTAPEEFVVTASNGELVRVAVGTTVRFPGFSSSPADPELGVVVEPAGLPEDVQIWGRRFEGPAWPAWVGVAGAIESVAVDAAEIRARIL